VIELEGGESTAPSGHDRRRALAVGFAMCLAVGSAFLGQDGPIAVTQPAAQPALALQSATPSDVVLFAFPDRLANEPPPPMAWMPVRIRRTEGLAVQAQRPGEISVVTWTELGTVYLLSSDRRQVDQLLDIANNLR
jgi:hypothetical protein